MGFKFRNLENEISIWVRKWELKTCVLKPKFESPNSRLLSQRAIINSEKVQSLGLTAEPCRKPKTNNQQLLRNKSKLKYEENLRFEIPDPKMKDPKNNKLNSRFTLIGPLLTFSFLVIFWGTSEISANMYIFQTKTDYAGVYSLLKDLLPYLPVDYS